MTSGALNGMDDMTSLKYRQDVLSYASLMKSLHPDVSQPSALAEQVMELRTAQGEMALKLPLYCTESSLNFCELVDQLPELNDVLCFVGAEAVEIAHGKLSLRLYERTEKVCHFRIMEVLAVYLHCILARHSCVHTLQAQATPFHFVEATMDALARNSSLFSLVIGSSLGSRHLNEKLARMLASPFAPERLTVISHSPNFSHALRLVLSNLRQNMRVTKITFKGFHINSTDMRFASDLLAANCMIQEMSFIESTWDLTQGPDNWHARAVVKLLESTAHLRRLVVPFEFISEEVCSILQAAQRCESLKELHFPVLFTPGLEVVFMALNVSPLVEKLRVGTFCVAADTAASSAVALLQNAFSGPQRLKSIDLLFGPRGDSPWLVGGHCGGHLTNLSVTDCTGQTLLHPDFAWCLGAYLPLTRSLKTLTIAVATFQESAKYVIQGLALNGSIEELFMNNFSAQYEDVCLLCTWISRSQQVHSVQVYFDKTVTGLFLETLAGCMQYNYTLTSLSIGCHRLETVHELQVKSITRRNFGLVQCAASYVLGCPTRRAEVAFKIVAWHPQLLPAVQKMGLMGEKEAKLRIRRAGQSSAL
ncbi:uncharacterized protein [Dermacentor albipictus]|uniref:uncharacterized protein isoform X3 n=1 Tax=Dermacentor albipictus TaxID=60249 RepID=UPI0031FC7842